MEPVLGGETRRRKSHTVSDDSLSFQKIFVERREWWDHAIFAIVILCSLCGAAALIMSAYTLSRSSVYNARNHPVSQQMPTLPLNHVLNGPTPVVLTLPNDLSGYVGNLYTIDCATSPEHSVVISPGALGTSWSDTPGIRTATCTGGATASSGFSFRVVTKSRIRVVGTPDNIAFSA